MRFKEVSKIAKKPALPSGNMSLQRRSSFPSDLHRDRAGDSQEMASRFSIQYPTKALDEFNFIRREEMLVSLSGDGCSRRCPEQVTGRYLKYLGNHRKAIGGYRHGTALIPLVSLVLDAELQSHVCLREARSQSVLANAPTDSNLGIQPIFVHVGQRSAVDQGSTSNEVLYPLAYTTIMLYFPQVSSVFPGSGVHICLGQPPTSRQAEQ